MGGKEGGRARCDEELGEGRRIAEGSEIGGSERAGEEG